MNIHFFPLSSFPHTHILIIKEINHPLKHTRKCLSPKCAANTGVGVEMSPHCFIKYPNGPASYTASGSKV